MITKYLQYIKESNKYKKNDYVLLDVEKIKKREKEETSGIEFEDDEDYEPLTLQKYGKIYIVLNRQEAPIRVILSNDGVYDVEKDEIIRYLTPEEIEEYESQKAAKKYNL